MRGRNSPLRYRSHCFNRSSTRPVKCTESDFPAVVCSRVHTLSPCPPPPAATVSLDTSKDEGGQAGSLVGYLVSLLLPQKPQTLMEVLMCVCVKSARCFELHQSTFLFGSIFLCYIILRCVNDRSNYKPSTCWPSDSPWSQNYSVIEV